VVLYIPCSKKVVHQAHIDNSVNSQRIFKFPALAHSLENFAIKNHQRFHHTQNGSLHYLVKCKLSKIAIEPKHGNRKLSAHELKTRNLS